MKPAQAPPKVRLVVKAKPEIQIPTAQEPPPPVIASTKKPPYVKKVNPEFKASKRARFEENYQKALELSQQHPPMSVEVGHQIVLGQFTLEDWQARCQAKKEYAAAKKQRKRQHLQKQESLLRDIGQAQESSWFEQFAHTQELIWMESAREGELNARLQATDRYTVTVVKEDQTLILFKTQISALSSASDQSQCALMRRVIKASRRNKYADKSPLKRWPFPHEQLQQLVGKRVGVETVNGSLWTGYVRWANVFSFMLATQPDGGAEVILFKHACCSLSEITD